jgi:glucose-6-phosphate isomerase
MEIKSTMKKKADIRYLYEMRMVLYDKEWAKTAENIPLYYMYRGIKEKNDLRYDITIIPPKMLGKELVRTKGNRNSEGYQELYTVLEGKALFFMQKVKGKVVEDAVAVEAKPGDWVIVPPDYAIITINPSNKVLKTGNWVSKKTENIYQGIEEMKGACFFYTQSGWKKNKNYVKIPTLRFEETLKLKPKDLDFLK